MGLYTISLQERRIWNINKINSNLLVSNEFTVRKQPRLSFTCLIHKDKKNPSTILQAILTWPCTNICMHKHNLQMQVHMYSLHMTCYIKIFMTVVPTAKRYYWIIGGRGSIGMYYERNRMGKRKSEIVTKVLYTFRLGAPEVRTWIARLFPACFPPLKTVKAGTGRTRSDFPERSAICL